MIITLQQMYSNKETKESECQQLGTRLQIFEPPTSVDGVEWEILLTTLHYKFCKKMKDGFNFDPMYVSYEFEAWDQVGRY